jgi:O-antigen/teichoic acid export membrane protein
LSDQGLKQRFVRAAGWTVLSHGLSQVIRLGSNLVLTRLLAPDLYGVMSVGYVVMTGLWMFSDIGLSAGAVQNRRGNDAMFLNVTWVVQIGRGVVITLAALAFAVGIGWAQFAGWVPPQSVYADPKVPVLIALISAYGIITGFESTRTIWARRQLSLGRIARIDLSCQIATTIFQLVWALISPTVWALAGGWLFGAALRVVLTHAALPGPPNRFQWNREAFREVFDFGKWVFVSSSVSFFLSSGDRLLLAAFLDATTMGYYTVALLLTNALQEAIGRVVGIAVLPALAEVMRDKPSQLPSTLYRIRWPIDVACLLGAGMLFMLGDPIVHILYDSRYASAGWMLSVLALTLVATRLNVFDQCLLAMGRIRLLTALNVVRLIAMFALIPLGHAVAGVPGAVVAVVASALFSGGCLLVVQQRLGLLSVRRELLALPLFGAGLALGWVGAAVYRRLI